MSAECTIICKDFFVNFPVLLGVPAILLLINNELQGAKIATIKKMYGYLLRIRIPGSMIHKFVREIKFYIVKKITWPK